MIKKTIIFLGGPGFTPSKEDFKFWSDKINDANYDKDAIFISDKYPLKIFQINIDTDNCHIFLYDDKIKEYISENQNTIKNIIE